MHRLVPALLFLATTVSAQQAERVDALFADWNKRETPGFAVAVIRDGRTVLARGYGMADLERDVAITPKSVFDIGSTSKQFTAAAVLLLAAEGKLSLDDDVRKFLPELPSYERPVTVRHLLHHTSGLRDYLGLMGLSGLSSMNDYSDEETIALIARQKALNFAPGDDHLYSNSGYYLLSQIVERASGMSLRRYADARIFQPLGMTSTHFHDDPTELVRHRAVGYSPRGKGFAIDMSNFHVTGDGALYTTVEDLARWDANFYEPKVGGAALLEGLHRRGKLTSGKELDYAAGLMHAKYKGLAAVRHGGAWAGYRAEMMRIPSKRLTVIVLSNLGSADPTSMAEKVTDIYLDLPPSSAPPASSSSTPVTLSAEQLAPFAGMYFDPKAGTYRSIELRDGVLRYVRNPRSANDLRPIANDRFEMTGVPMPVVVSFPSAGAMHVQVNDGDPSVWRRVEPFTPPDLTPYAGTYRSDELTGVSRVRVQDGRLTISAGYDPAPRPLEPRERDVFEGPGRVLRFERNAKGEVTGFVLDAGRVKGIRFVRE